MMETAVVNTTIGEYLLKFWIYDFLYLDLTTNIGPVDRQMPIVEKVANRSMEIARVP
jgi:hypothetical protein